MKQQLFDMFSKQALQELHRYRAVMFSPTCWWSEDHSQSLSKNPHSVPMGRHGAEREGYAQPLAMRMLFAIYLSYKFRT